MHNGTMSSRKRRQHYVPAFYLRRFADGDQQLRAYGRLDGKRRDIAVRHAAVEVDLYSIEPEGEATADSVEDTISEIEGQIAPGLDRLVNGTWPPDHETRSYVANFVALQSVRTREHLHSMKAMTDLIAKFGFSTLTPDNVRQVLIDSGDYEDPTEADVSEHLGAIQEFDEYTVELDQASVMLNMLQLASDFVEPIFQRH